MFIDGTDQKLDLWQVAAGERQLESSSVSHRIEL